MTIPTEPIGDIPRPPRLFAAAEERPEYADPLSAQTVQPARDPSEPRSAVLKRVLIADDNSDVVESLAMLLRMDGHEVAVAHDGQGALDTFMSFHPDIALLDIGMPGLSGYEVARKMRAASTGQVVTLIAMTGWGREHDKAQAKDAGFDHHFTKPVDPEHLRSLLQS